MSWFPLHTPGKPLDRHGERRTVIVQGFRIGAEGFRGFSGETMRDLRSDPFLRHPLEQGTVVAIDVKDGPSKDRELVTLEVPRGQAVTVAHWLGIVFAVDPLDGEHRP